MTAPSTVVLDKSIYIVPAVTAVVVIAVFLAVDLVISLKINKE